MIRIEIFSMTWQPGMVSFSRLPLAPSPSHQHDGCYGSKCHPQPLMIGLFYGLWVTGSQGHRKPGKIAGKIGWPCGSEGSEIPTRQAGLWTRTRNEVVLSANG